MILKTIGDGAGVGPVINLKAVGDAILIEDIMPLDRVEP
jgi:hypothetical protein